MRVNVLAFLVVVYKKPTFLQLTESKSESSDNVKLDVLPSENVQATSPAA